MSGSYILSAVGFAGFLVGCVAIGTALVGPRMVATRAPLARDLPGELDGDLAGEPGLFPQPAPVQPWRGDPEPRSWLWCEHGVPARFGGCDPELCAASRAGCGHRSTGACELDALTADTRHFRAVHAFVQAVGR